MNTAKDLAFISIFTALLIGSQFVFSFIAGVEIVTVLFLTFAFVFGIKRSLLLGTAFSLLRCLIFGFFPNVLLLYLLYYTIFAVSIGGVGNKVKHKSNRKIYLLLIALAILLTLLFTLLDDLITPLFYGLSKKAALAYAYASLTVCLPQIFCATITVALLFPILYPVCYKYHPAE